MTGHTDVELESCLGPGDGGTGSSRFHSSAGLGFGSSSSGHSTRVTRVAGVNSASASAFGANHGGEAAHHFKKTVRRSRYFGQF